MYSQSPRRASARFFQSAVAITLITAATASSAAAQHVVSGTVRTSDGRPLAGATIRVSGATGAARGTTVKTQSDRNGNYRIEVRPGDYDVDAFYDLAFDGQTYRELLLDRTNEGCGRQLSERGIVRHFVLRLSGPMRCTANFNPNEPGSFAGASVIIAPGNLPASAAVRFTFTPIGPLADGTQAKAMTFERTGVMLAKSGGRLGQTAWLHDIPLARYRVSAEATLPGGTPRALLLRDNAGGNADISIEIAFPAVQMFPYGIRSASISVVDRSTQPVPPPSEPGSDDRSPGRANRMSGGLPVGRYECSHRSEYAGDIPNGRTIVILEGGRYQAWGGSGAYAGSSSGAIQWTSGPFAQRGVTVTFAQEGSRAVLTVKGGAAADPGGISRCVRFGG